MKPAAQTNDLEALSSEARKFTPLFFLYVAAFSAAFATVAYELLLASYATFLVGGTIFQYSLVLSLMMMSMGLGALAAQRDRKKSLERLLLVEGCLSFLALVALPTLYFAYAKNTFGPALLFAFVILIGMGIGMEIPLLSRIDERVETARILFFDYLGGFVGGLLFPLWLLPRLGFFRIAALLSLVNALVALMMAIRFSPKATRIKWIGSASCLVVASLFFVLFAETLRKAMEAMLFHIK